MSILIVRHKQT